MALFHHHDAASTTTAAAAAASTSAASPTSTSSSSCPAYPTPVYDANSTAGTYTLQHLSVIVGGACALIPTLISLILILFHATHLSNRHEQVKIIRITSVIAVFAIIAFVNIVIQVEGAVYLAPWMEAYEAIALCSFFLLLCTYISPDAEAQREYFAADRASDGLAAYKKTWIATFQYPVVAILVALFTDITNGAGVFCINSNKPRVAHIWLQIVRTLSVGTAVVAILRFISRLRTELEHHHVFMKLFAFKGIVFVNTVQTTGFSFAVWHITPGNKVSYNDIATTLPNLLVFCEMMLFAVFFIFAYSFRPYVIRSSLENGRPMAGKYQGGFLGVKASVAALNPSEIVMGIVQAVKLLISKGLGNNGGEDHGERLVHLPPKYGQQYAPPQEQHYAPGYAPAPQSYR